MPALLMLDKGFSIKDPGSYLLAYRFWDSNPYFVSGSQYVYGPIFEAVGESVPVLRLLRLVMVLGCNAWFAWSFVSWLSSRRRVRLPAPKLSLALLLTATGGLSYLWGPLTPGYYDLTAQACLVLAALMLSALPADEPAAASPDPRDDAGAEVGTDAWWNPVIAGVAAVVLAVTKWSAAPVALLTVGVTVAGLARKRRPSGVRYLALSGVGLVAALVLMDRFEIRLGRFVGVMARVSSLTAHGNHGMGYLLQGYASSSASLLLPAVVVGLPLFAGYLVALRLEARGRRRHAVGSLAAAGAFVTFAIPLTGGWHGGSARGQLVIVVSLAGLLLAILAALSPAGRRQRRLGRGDRAVLVTLAVVPLVQAAGTNVPLLYVAAECMAMWVAAVLLLASRDTISPTSVTAVLTGLCVLIVAATMIAGTTTVLDPFEGGNLDSDRTSVPHLGLRVPTAAAAQYAALDTALRPYVRRGRTPMFSQDPTAGLIYQLGGVPVGSTWNDPGSISRTTGILELGCHDAAVSHAGAPVLLLDAHPPQAIVHALQHCGYDFPGHYREVLVRGGVPDLHIFVPDSYERR